MYKRQDENTPMFTRYESTWAPGSSFKPVTGAIGLTTGSFTESEDFGTSGTSWQKAVSYTHLDVYKRQPMFSLKNAGVYMLFVSISGEF